MIGPDNIGNPISTALAEAVAQIETISLDLIASKRQLDQIRATLIVNFGSAHGRSPLKVRIDESLPTHDMLFDVLRQLSALASKT